MKIAVADTKRGSKASSLMKAVKDGLRAHGVTVNEIRALDELGALEESDAAIICCEAHPVALNLGNGPRGKTLRLRRAIRQQCKTLGCPCLIIETGFISNSRHFKMRQTTISDTYWAAGWNGIKYEADYCLPDRIDGSRFHWRYPPDVPFNGDTVLVFGQVPGGYAERNIDWMAQYTAVQNQLQKQGLRGCLKIHPAIKSKALRRLDFILNHAGWVTSSDPLKYILLTKDVCCAVAWMSNACVDALMAGLPLVTLDGNSIARSFSSHDCVNLRHPPCGSYADRIELLHRVSFMQWRLEEFTDGRMWEQLKRKVEVRE